LRELALQVGAHRFQAVLGVSFPAGSAKVRSKQNCFRARENKVQRGQSAVDAVRFADLITMEGNIVVNPEENSLGFKGHIFEYRYHRYHWLSGGRAIVSFFFIRMFCSRGQGVDSQKVLY